MIDAQTKSYETTFNEPASSDEDDLLRAVGALQDELRSMTNDMRELAQQRGDLSHEVDTLQSEQHGGYWISESQRVIDDVNQLMRRYEAATRTVPARRRFSHSPTAMPRRRSTHSARGHARSHAGPSRATPDVGPDFFKKMFMFMMSELA